MLVDTNKQLELLKLDEKRSGGRVLVQEGLVNDLAGAFNRLRRELKLGVSDRISVNMILGPTMAWALYWNKDAFMKQCLVRELRINGDELTNGAAGLVSDPEVPEGALNLSDFSPVKIGGNEIDFPAYAVVN